jgi:3-deoxy-D-manno-octulosonic-acid transferase
VAFRWYFDRVAAILEKDNTLDYISQFKMILPNHCVEFWPKDEALLLTYKQIHWTEIHHRSLITSRGPNWTVKNSITKKTVLFSEKQGKPSWFWCLYHRHHRYSNQNL